MGDKVWSVSGNRIFFNILRYLDSDMGVTRMTDVIMNCKVESAPIDAKRAKDLFADSATIFYNKVKEIKEQVELGRYSRYSVMDDGKIRVNYFVYYDYSTYRKQLKEGKKVPPFDPQEIAELTPVSIVTVIA
jgi:hypothetical protein